MVFSGCIGVNAAIARSLSLVALLYACAVGSTGINACERAKNAGEEWTDIIGNALVGSFDSVTAPPFIHGLKCTHSRARMRARERQTTLGCRWQRSYACHLPAHRGSENLRDARRADGGVHAEPSAVHYLFDNMAGPRRRGRARVCPAVAHYSAPVVIATAPGEEDGCSRDDRRSVAHA